MSMQQAQGELYAVTCALHAPSDGLSLSPRIGYVRAPHTLLTISSRAASSALRTVLCALCSTASSVHAYAYACSACSVRTLTLAWLSKAVLETPREQSVHTKTGMVLSRRGWWSRTHL